MSDHPVIDIPSENAHANNTTALARVESGAVGRALSLEEVGERLKFIRSVMADVMKEGQDYGKIPGCGDKPGLFQPGAQKLLMTFNLREQVKSEVLREIAFAGLPPGHREYEFVVTVFPSGQESRNGWDGVGTCSTLESKYRFRGSKRRCPKCGAEAIIKGKAEYGGGWVCFQKKGGCKAKFADKDPVITSQADKPEENPNPADTWNTVRKMAFKRALVAAAINATNTSELWSQDLEDIDGNNNARRGNGRAPEPEAEEAEDPGETDFEQLSTTATTSAHAPAPHTALRYPTEATRAWALKELQANPGGSGRIVLTDFLRKAGCLLPNEEVEAWPFQYVPSSKGDMDLLKKAIADFENGLESKKPFHHGAPPADEPKRPVKAKPADKTKAIEVPRDPDAGDQSTAPVEIDPTWGKVTGKIERVTEQPGTNTRGPYTKYGIKIGNEWFNSFSTRVGALAQKNQGREVDLYWLADDYGKKAEHIEA